MGNKYVSKEVIERFFRNQIANSVKNQLVFEKGVEIYQKAKDSQT